LKPRPTFARLLKRSTRPGSTSTVPSARVSAEVHPPAGNRKGIDLVIIPPAGSQARKTGCARGCPASWFTCWISPSCWCRCSRAARRKRPISVRILVALDGSAFAEQLLPYARLLAKQFDCELMLICVPAVPESEKYRAPASVIHASANKPKPACANTLSRSPKACVQKG
jgi:hypothetical protein